MFLYSFKLMQKKKTKRWSPAKLNDDTVKRLEEIFKWWWNVTQACLYARISRQTFYNRMEWKWDFFDKKGQKLQKDFIERIQLAQQYPSMWCRQTVVEAWRKWNRKAAARWLSKKDDEFKEKKTEITINNNLWFTCIEIVDATWETTSTTDTQTERTSEEFSG